jgi:hypothetical protein
MKILKSALLGMTVLALVSAPALADASTSVTLPYGDLVQSIGTALLPLVGTIVIGVLGWSARFLPGSVNAMITAFHVDQLLSNAINFGVNRVLVDTAGKSITVDTHNAVVAAAADYAVNHGAKWLIDYMGGPVMIEQKILARINIAVPTPPVA